MTNPDPAQGAKRETTHSAWPSPAPEMCPVCNEEVAAHWRGRPCPTPQQGAKVEAEGELRVGSTIWYFDENRRIYAEREPGRPGPHSGPIYYEHWRPTKITGENRVSWITNYGKASKRGPHPGWAFSLTEVDEDCWMHGHRYEIVRLVERCRDAEVLRKIAAILGWEPK